MLRSLQKALRQNEKQRANLMDSLKICDIDSVKKSIFEEIAAMEQQHTDLENAIAEEKARHVTLTEPEIAFFLTQLQHGDMNDLKYRKALIAVFINAIYLYDDGRMLFVLNTSDRPPVLDDMLREKIERNSEKVSRSSFEQSGPP